MKRLALSVLCTLLLITAWSQNEPEVKEKGYSVSGGLLGAFNFSKFRVPDKFNSNINFDGKMGWSAGGWLSLPVTSMLSIEPQLMYSSYRYFTSDPTPLLLNDGRIEYISLPVLLKFHLGSMFALTAGGQADFLTSVVNNNGPAIKDDFRKTSFSLSGGLEIMPHGRVAIFGRYLLGLTNM
ncbi:MAG TPA: porin family protein, partial [Chitinophagaceae bacterium]|nr:porin family protein [Chitinophagaceae bacterium]